MLFKIYGNHSTMASLKDRIIENGSVMGSVSMDTADTQFFEICSVEEWTSMSDEEANEMAIEAFWESGLVDLSW